MTELNDYNISQLSFKNLPSDKRLKYIMHGNVYQFESEFYINGIFIDDDKNYYLSLLPLKGLAAFPLGTIFENLMVTNRSVLTNVKHVRLTLNMKLTGFNQLKDIAILKDKFSQIPDEISGYTGQKQALLNQLVATYKDQITGAILYIPHYEIARWYYIRSSSLCRQVLSSNLDGLYHKATYFDSSLKEASIIMKYGSSNGDAADIFRFAKDDFANTMFHNFGLDLSANKFSPNKKEKYLSTKIRANFPVHGDLNLKIKGFPLPSPSKHTNAIFVYQFIEEDSNYPFEELNVYRYGPNKKKEKEAIIEKKSPDKSDIKTQIEDITPSSEYENQTTENNIAVNELRKGLLRKQIKYKPMLTPNENNESITEHKLHVSGLDFELSFNDASKSGDNKFLHTSLVNKTLNTSEEFIERENNLTIFKRMLFLLNDIDKKQKTPNSISIIILDHANLPRKPKEYQGRAKWKKAYLNNGRHRQYMLAQITINKQVFYSIEIEQANSDEKIATSFLYKNNSSLPLHTLHKIIRDYVNFNGQWLFPNETNSFFMYHTGSELDKAKRLYHKFLKI